MNTPPIPATVARLRQTFDSGKTRPIEWRLAQLGEIERAMRDHESDFAEALQKDLGKCRFEAVMTEMSFVEQEAKYARKHLRNWMRHTRVRTPMMAQPGRSYIEPEPKGVVLIIAPWNYPMSMVAAPLVGAVAAGNCAVMKPSEVTTRTSTALAAILPRYLDKDAFAVVEANIPETTELLEQKFDHILYTGNERVAQIVMTAAAKHLTPVTLRARRQEPVHHRQERRHRGCACRRIAWASSSTPARPASRRSRAGAPRRGDAVHRRDHAPDQGLLRRGCLAEPGPTAASRANVTPRVSPSCWKGARSTTAAAWTWPVASWSRRSCSTRPPTRR